MHIDVGIDGEAGAHALRFDEVKGRYGVFNCLEMETDGPSTCVTETLDIFLGMNDHEVDVEGVGAVLAHGLHEGETKGYVGHKNAVHDIDVKPIGFAAVDHFQIIGQVTKIGRKYGWSY
jgi:hypothetical protein